MPAGTAPAATASGAQEGQSGLSPMIKSALQGIAIFVGMQFLMGQIMGKNKGAQSTTTTDESGAIVTIPANTGDIPAFNDRPRQLDEGAIWQALPQRAAPMWPLGTPMDITIVVSPTFAVQPIAHVEKERIIVEEVGFIYGDYNQKRSIDTSFAVPKDVQNNGTLWAHFFVGITGSKLDPSSAGYDSSRAYYFAHPLTQYLAQKKIKKTKNLLAAAEEEEVEEVPTGPVITSHYHPNVTLSFIPDSAVITFPQMQPASRQYVRLEATGQRDGTGANGWYYPVLFVNTFWQLKTHMTALNSTVARLPIHVDLNHLANWKFGIMASIDENSKQVARNAAHGQIGPGGGDGSEFEMIKEILLDSNPWLLGTTVIVSIFHMIFEVLAFKSDISHYRNKKNNVGISVRSILGNVFMQAVIFLYLMDNNENTSWMILFSQGMGIVLEFWKITTIVNVRIRDAPGSFIPYRIAFEDKHELSETEEKTKEYDAVAFKYLYMIAVPLLLAYAGYSLYYETHKSWYSFIIATLVGSVYAYGFLMMVPSLYINYRLKSVAHMPARAMMYKFLNTFIDDLFAFTIKMPTLHRLATLRDDVIFFVYLYQSWKYKIDYKRVNEFGQGGDEEVEKIANEPLKSITGADSRVNVGTEGASKTDEVIAKATGSEKKGKASKRK
ncbi:cleft lip and palate transmembrane protein 1-domain-containing protein [Amylocarpus encephaloides]|uniref:Cleft lip and palate transmembrane protein 1-domain-containing protein n=1 Tax=Amylocarpus encephaloides TaxID=45428 RepID=A0A9P7Y9V4_9HELO|nr:cleft lip and palate transmembrane protein 1-domain-containing protein [Amylocarpus encephaloides]